MDLRIAERRAAFHELHQAGCFVIPNPWDVGSAHLLAQLGFKAIATSSAGFAWSMARRDNGVTRDEVLAHLRAITAAVDIPVGADFEGGFAVNPEAVAANVAAATDTGVAGLSIEDSTGNPDEPLFAFDLAVERIAAAKQVIDTSGSRLLLTARSEGFIVGRPDLGETVRRLTAYAQAGADCLHAPGLRSLAEIETVVRAVAPRPVNVLVGTDFSSVAELAAAGVRRISVGGALARVALSAFLDAATEIATQGTFTRLGPGRTFPDINGRFGVR